MPPALRSNRPTPAPPAPSRARCSPPPAPVFLVATGTASADFFTPEYGGSPNADRIDNLYKVVLVVAVVVFVGVDGALFYSLSKFRARKGAVAAQIRGNTRLEIGWTVGAAVILVVLAVFTFAALPGIRDPENSGANGYAIAGRRPRRHSPPSTSRRTASR